MYKSLLIPTDGSELASKAVNHGIAFAKAIGAKVTVLTVSAPYHIFTLETTMVEYSPEEYKKYIGDRAARILGEAASMAKAANVPCETVHVEQEHVHQAIIDIAAAKNCDLITMASHGRGGLAAIVLGSVTVKVLTHSKLPVLVHR